MVVAESRPVAMPKAPNEGFRVFVGDMVTGLITADLPPSAVDWGMRLNDAGPVGATFQARAKELSRLNLRANTSPLKQFLGVAYNNQILECGPIWKRAYDPSKESLKVTGAGIWSILDVVKALPWYALVNNVSPTKVSLDIVNKTLGSIARELVRISIATNPLNPGLPILIPDVVPSTNERHYPGYNLPWLGDLLRNLTGVDNGPDIRFKPQFKPDDARFVQWVMLTGTEDYPLLSQAGDDWVWDGSVDKSGVVNFGYQEDATDTAARTYQPGQGSEADMKLKWADDLTLIQTAGYPWTEKDVANKDVEDLGLLQRYANAAIGQYSRPVETWTFEVRANERPLLGRYAPGDFAQVFLPENHPIIRGSQRRTRLLAVDGDHTNTVKLTVAPLRGRV